MEVKSFIASEKEELAKFMTSEDTVVTKLFLSPSCNPEIQDVFYLFYEKTEEQLEKEKQELSKVEKIAIALESDKTYKVLKNATQRELFLLQNYDIPSSQAKKVIEFYNMKKMLQEENEDDRKMRESYGEDSPTSFSGRGDK